MPRVVKSLPISLSRLRVFAAHADQEVVLGRAVEGAERGEGDGGVPVSRVKFQNVYWIIGYC